MTEQTRPLATSQDLMHVRYIAVVEMEVRVTFECIARIKVDGSVPIDCQLGSTLRRREGVGGGDLQVGHFDDDGVLDNLRG